MFRLILRQYSGMSTQEHIQKYTIISKGPLLIFTVFFTEDDLSTAKICTLYVREIKQSK